MITKAVIVLVAFLFTVQASVVSSRVISTVTDDSPDQNKSINHIFEVLLTVLKILTTAVDLVFNTVIRAVESGLHNTDLLKEILINTVESVVDKVKEEVMHDLEKLQNVTAGVDVDISSCVQEAEDTLETTADNTIENGGSCVADLVHDFGEAFETVILDLKSANKEIEEASYKISSCQNQTAVLVTPCLFLELNKIWDVVTSVGNTYKSDFDRFGNTIGRLSRVEDICVQSNLDEFKEDNQKILSDFTTCVAKQLNGVKHPSVFI